MRILFCFMPVVFLFGALSSSAQVNNAPAIPEADGYTIIPGAKMPPDKKRIYRAIYDATKAAKENSQIVPAINMAGSELNALAVCGIPFSNAKFVVVFHGAAIDAILDDAHYKEKYGIPNPNLKLLSELKKAGVKLFVCGQNLLAENIDPKIISPDVVVASDALIVLMSYQNDGYALMSF
ncbi:MAG TPA: DsrE family protein [Chitinophagaceae bacterium]